MKQEMTRIREGRTQPTTVFPTCSCGTLIWEPGDRPQHSITSTDRAGNAIPLSAQDWGEQQEMEAEDQHTNWPPQGQGSRLWMGLSDWSKG
jgi:hypothetical protein